MPAQHSPLRLGFLLSGTGRTLVNLIDYLASHPIAEIVVVVSSKPGVKGLAIADDSGIPNAICRCREPEDSTAIFDLLDQHDVDYALLGGWLRLLRIPERWQRRVLNIHPSLIPRHAGHGFYGRRVHESVLESGDRESGCTVHFVDNAYDHGPVLLQEVVPVEPDDDAHTLADRVFDAECRAYPRAIDLLASDAVEWDGDRLRRPG